MMYHVDAPTVPSLVNALYSNRNDFTLNELITVIWGLTRMKLVTRRSWDPKTTDTTQQMVQLLFDQVSSWKVVPFSSLAVVLKNPESSTLLRGWVRHRSLTCRGHLVNLLYAFSYTKHPSTPQL